MENNFLESYLVACGLTETVEAASEKHLLCPLKEQWPEGDHGCSDVILTKTGEETD